MNKLYKDVLKITTTNLKHLEGNTMEGNEVSGYLQEIIANKLSDKKNAEEFINSFKTEIKLELDSGRMFDEEIINNPNNSKEYQIEIVNNIADYLIECCDFILNNYWQPIVMNTETINLITTELLTLKEND